MITGEDLRKLRKSAGLTQTQLAEQLGNGGYTKSIVAAIENGRRNIGLNLVRDWAKACGYVAEVVFRKLETRKKTPEQIKARMDAVNAILQAADPYFAGPTSSDDPEVNYLRGYADALLYALLDVPDPFMTTNANEPTSSHR